MPSAMPQADVIVRDPVVITAGLPRFLAPGDAAVMRLDIANTDAPDGDYQFAVETAGGLSTGSGALPDKVALTPGKRQSITVPLVAETAGDARVTVRLGPRGRTGGGTDAVPPNSPGHHAGDKPPGGRSRTRRLQPAHRPRTSGRQRPARRLCQRRRVAFRRLRRSIAASGARPLPVWLRRADHQPGAAAALCQRACRRRRHAGRPGAARPHPGRDLPGSQLPVVVGKLRPLGARLGRSLARFLRHGFPDAGARTQLRCARGKRCFRR